MSDFKNNSEPIELTLIFVSNVGLISRRLVWQFPQHPLKSGKSRFVILREGLTLRCGSYLNPNPPSRVPMLICYYEPRLALEVGVIYLSYAQLWLGTSFGLLMTLIKKASPLLG